MRLLIARSVCTAPPEVIADDFSFALDALDLGGSLVARDLGGTLVGHWPMGDLSNRVLGGTDITEQGTHEPNLPQLALGGIPSRAFDGSGAHGVVAPPNAPFVTPAGTVGLLIQPDTVGAKMNLVNLSDGSAGSFSLEVEGGGVPRAFRRRSDGTVVNVRGSAGLVVAGRAYLFALTWGSAGLRLYLMDQNRAPGLIPESVDEAAWVPSATFSTGQDIYIGRWHSGDVDFYNGCLGHLFWFSRQLSLAELETLAPMVRQVPYLPSFNAGNVQESTTTVISMLNRGSHPESGFTVTASSPTPGGATATGSGTDVSYDAPMVGADTLGGFGVTITTAEGAVSAPATVSLTITDAVAIPPPVANADPRTMVAGPTALTIPVLANDTGVPVGATVEIVANPGTRFIPISGNTQIQFTPPTTIGAATVFTGSYRIVGSTGTSNTANIPVTVNPAGLSFTPFHFVTTRRPTVIHISGPSGGIRDVRARPPYNATDPWSVAKICPISGLRFCRVTGNRGTPLMIDNGSGLVDSGFVWNSILKTENAPKAPRSWNADGSLLMIAEWKSRSTQQWANQAHAVLYDVDGNHGASAPWRVIRAKDNSGFFDGVPLAAWFWDPLNPYRAYAALADGMYEWWPAGAPSSAPGTGGNTKSVGQKTKLFNWASGMTDWNNPRGGRMQPSHTGIIWHASVKKSSTDWGGILVDLRTPLPGGAVRFGPYVPNTNTFNDDNDRGLVGTGALGIIGVMEYADNESLDMKMYDMRNGQFKVFVDMPNAMTHSDNVHVDGVEYYYGDNRKDPHKYVLMNLTTGVQTVKSDSDSGTTHSTCRNYQDTFENHGATGGSTSGIRYGITSQSTRGNPPSIFGVRLGANDLNKVRYIIHTRGIWHDNVSETHHGVSPVMNYLAFPSTWELPGIETDQNYVSCFVVEIPDAWFSRKNSGADDSDLPPQGE